jgi:hypothetical protein
MFYGSDAHAESAAAIFSIIASCRLHAIDPQQYLDEILRILPYWPRDRYLELAPNNWPVFCVTVAQPSAPSHTRAARRSCVWTDGHGCSDAHSRNDAARDPFSVSGT